MAAGAVQERGRAVRPAGLLAALLETPMRAIEIPMAWLQRRAGLAAIIALFLAPNLLVFGVFVLLPIAINVLYSFTAGPAMFLGDRTFVGLDQYRTLFDCENYLEPLTCRQDAFWRAANNTGIFVVAQVSAMILVSLVTALVLDREMRARGFWRAVFFFPVLLSPVVVALMWKWILLREGLLNALVVWLGGEPTLWLAEPGWAMFWAIFVSVWAHLGFYTLILLAGLQAIPRDLYEAAAMDGTRPFRTFRRITLPLLWPNLVVVLILALIRAVQIFDEVFVLTGGGPGSRTLFITQYIYQIGFRNTTRNLGLAATASIVMGVTLVVLTSIQLAVSAWRERRERA
jgi:alpha-1,4-digalacturonate transport system permease protein